MTCSCTTALQIYQTHRWYTVMCWLCLTCHAPHKSLFWYICSDNTYELNVLNVGPLLLQGVNGFYWLAVTCPHDICFLILLWWPERPESSERSPSTHLCPRRHYTVPRRQSTTFALCPGPFCAPRPTRSHNPRGLRSHCRSADGLFPSRKSTTFSVAATQRWKWK